MTGATIIFAPQIADQILDRLPATEAGAMTTKDLMPFFSEKRSSEVRRALARLYSARIIRRKYVVEHQARTWRYWRSAP